MTIEVLEKSELSSAILNVIAYNSVSKNGCDFGGFFSHNHGTGEFSEVR
jgi:hypothetical protein